MIQLPTKARNLQTGGVLVVLVEDCPASIEFAEELEGILTANDLGGHPAHAVIVGGKAEQRSVAPILAGTIETSIDSFGRWAGRNGFLFGPIVAVLDAGGRVGRLLAWNMRRDLIPYPPEPTTPLDSIP
jgi:hypothetical protein